MTFERILSHFQVRKRGTGKAQCICPAHADREASLTLTDGNDRALIKCHAGSEINNIVAKIPGWERLKTPRKFDGYGQQRGFRKIAMKTTEEESGNSEFVVVSEKEQMELPFD